MTNRRKGLGRGLDALLGEAGAAADSAVADDLRELPLDQLEGGRYQPRREFDPAALQALAQSIRTQGVVQPIVVRAIPETDRYEIIAGERRWRAAQLAELETIPSIIRDISDEMAVAVALIENIQREDLNPLEEANALQRLTGEFGMTHQAIAEAVGRSRVGVSNLLRLLELTAEVKAYIGDGALEMGHARALLALDPAAQAEAAARVVSRGLTVRQTEALVRQLLAGESGESVDPPRPDPNIRRLQDDLADRLGASVRIEAGQQGKGRLVIRYNSLDELDGILEHIR
ncbi:ParB/RepB/Spo0J family partition protein [Spiribacter vilamensis]|uniref:Probable chromosome-partitioning protein ParB n=1 Tax=Spiribacter vilamensis TaxID=531306 RepID=A0A4Q8D2A1_9GAMM|nr:ParB/RepB/Spo0J family partition protein [Spiribacter vilamensis]RZU99531.1 chromosome segregation DNA-binding protein [Spiribacter vilamensis]TVO61499.1 ParB/RepB/Spo0J family partition protein [Spiribacter vilamensis]